MKISELAAETGFSVDTIRFYEKKGLLTDKHIERRPNNYRHYTEAAVSRLRLIGWGKLLGFTLAEIESLIDQWESEAITDIDKDRLLCEKLAEVEARIQELNQLRTYIKSKLVLVRTGDRERWDNATAAS